MIYSPEEKARMDTLLQVFRDYVNSVEQYDIVYSEKAGFIRICVGEGADQIYFSITGFDHMLRMFIDDFLMDEEIRVRHYLRRDYDHVRALLSPILDKLGDDRDLAFSTMEQQFENCRQRCEQTRQERLLLIRQTEDILEDLRQSVTP